jgi:hypothetical protein
LEGNNMKKHLFVVLYSGVLVCGGCASTVKKVDVNRGLDSYYSQPRVVDLVTIKGSNMTITATGVNEMKVSSMLPPLNAIPREPGVLEKIVDGVVGLGKWGLGWHYGSQVMTSALQQPRTVSPEVVYPQVIQAEQ